LIYDYKLLSKRFFQGAHFDRVWIYDVTDPVRIMALALTDSQVCLFLSERMAEVLREEKSNEAKMLREGLLFAATYCDGIYVLKKETKEEFEKLLPQLDQIRLLDTDEALCELAEQF
jgi:hypothetical protein